MANTNRTEIYIEGSKEAIDNFEERFDNKEKKFFLTLVFCSVVNLKNILY